MNLELPRRAVLAVVLFVAVSLALLLVILGRLGTLPGIGPGARVEQALLANAGGLPPQADVLVHGVRVGVVSAVATAQGGTLVTMRLGHGAPALHDDASVRVGFKTPLGEPFVDLDPGRGRRPAGPRLRVVQSVEIDQALSFLDPAGRADLRSVTLALGAGAGAPDTAPELAATVSGIGSLSASVGRLAGELRAQRGDLSAAITDGRTVLDTLAARAGELSALERSARGTLSAVAGERGALGATLGATAPLLRSARSTLADARGLISDATPVVSQTAAAAPAIATALRALPAGSAALAAILARADAFAAAVVPALRAAGAGAAPLARAITFIGPALADLVPVGRYLAPRGRTIAAWFANTAALGDHGDAKGDWARFFVMFDPSTLLGNPAGAPATNAYTAPGDAAGNEPYRAGGFPRLLPYSPALAR